MEPGARGSQAPPTLPWVPVSLGVYISRRWLPGPWREARVVKLARSFVAFEKIYMPLKGAEKNLQ